MLFRYLITLISRFGDMLAGAGWNMGLVRVATGVAVVVCVGLFTWGVYGLLRLSFSYICLLNTTDADDE